MQNKFSELQFQRFSNSALQHTDTIYNNNNAVQNCCCSLPYAACTIPSASNSFNGFSVENYVRTRPPMLMIDQTIIPTNDTPLTVLPLSSSSSSAIYPRTKRITTTNANTVQDEDAYVLYDLFFNSEYKNTFTPRSTKEIDEFLMNLPLNKQITPRENLQYFNQGYNYLPSINYEQIPISSYSSSPRPSISQPYTFPITMPKLPSISPLQNNNTSGKRSNIINFSSMNMDIRSPTFPSSTPLNASNFIDKNENTQDFYFSPSNSEIENPKLISDTKIPQIYVPSCKSAILSSNKSSFAAPKKKKMNIYSPNNTFKSSKITGQFGINSLTNLMMKTPLKKKPSLCIVPLCTKRSQGNGKCRAHGGGKRCFFQGCQKSAQRGVYCARHGGIQVCTIKGCNKNVRASGLCASHGGGKRCMLEGCDRPCRTKGLCTIHFRLTKNETNGGIKRCSVEGCDHPCRIKDLCTMHFASSDNENEEYMKNLNLPSLSKELL